MLHWGTRLGWAAAARPRAALAVMLAVVLAMVPGLFRLELRTDGHALVPPDDPAVAADRAARRLFGLRDPLLVILETTHPDGIFNAGTLDRLQRMTRALAALPGVGPDSVQSLSTEPSGGFYPGTSNFRPMLDPPPRTPERLAEVRRDVEAIDLLHGTLVSFDRRGAALLVSVPGSVDATSDEAIDRTALYHRIAAAVGIGNRLALPPWPFLPRQAVNSTECSLMGQGNRKHHRLGWLHLSLDLVFAVISRL